MYNYVLCELLARDTPGRQYATREPNSNLRLRQSHAETNAILSVDYKLSIILRRRRPEQRVIYDFKMFVNNAC